jgi:hypothetical protein
LTSHYDPKSGICYVESGLYYEKEYDANRIEIENAFSEGETGPRYGELDLRPDGYRNADGKCHIYPRNTSEISCRSKEEFDELAQKYFGIDRQLSGWPRAGTLGTTAPNRPTAEIPKESHVEAAQSQEHVCWEQAAKVTLDKKTSYFPDEPRIEYKSYYDPKSAKCYVESGLYWDNGKKYPPNKTSTRLVTIQNAFSDGEIYAYIALGPSSTILGCQISSSQQHCDSKEQFEQLVSKTFGIEHHHPLPPNTKVAASLPAPELASEAQVFEDTRYCYLNPNNKLQAPDGSLIACKELIAAIDVRLAQCKTVPESKTKECKTILKRFKDFQAGRL